MSRHSPKWRPFTIQKIEKADRHATLAMTRVRLCEKRSDVAICFSLH